MLLCVHWGQEIRQSCSQTCPPSRCCGKGGNKSKLSPMRFMTTVKKSESRWGPQRSTTRPSLDRRYHVFVCVTRLVKDSWEEIDGQWWSDVCLCLCSNKKMTHSYVLLLQSYLSKSSSSSSSALSFWLRWRTRGHPLFRPTGSKSAGEQLEHLHRHTQVRQ